MRRAVGLWPFVAAPLPARSAQSPFGLRLPDGDPGAGRAAFLDLRCNSCHLHIAALRRDDGYLHP